MASRALVSLTVITLAGCAVEAAHPRLVVGAHPLPVAHAAASAPPIAPLLVPATAPPVASDPAPPPKKNPYAYANLDPTDDRVVGPPEPRPTCAADLAAAGVVWKPWQYPVHTPYKSKTVCGAPQVVLYLKSPAGIAHHPAPALTCTMALALARFETLIQEEAKRTLGRKVVAIDNVGTYVCRDMTSSPGLPSQHSYANAIDLTSFTLDDGKTLTVLADFAPKLSAPTKAASRFLRAISTRAYDEDVFSSVLTPFYDAHHDNHFHLDLARHRGDGTRPVLPGS